MQGIAAPTYTEDTDDEPEDTDEIIDLLGGVK